MKDFKSIFFEVWDRGDNAKRTNYGGQLYLFNFRVDQFRSSRPLSRLLNIRLMFTEVPF